MGVKFVGVRKDSRGDITHLKTSEGQIVAMAEARRLALSGEVDSLTDLHQDGSWEIADSAGDARFNQGNNLTDLPEF